MRLTAAQLGAVAGGVWIGVGCMADAVRSPHRLPVDGAFDSRLIQSASMLMEADLPEDIEALRAFALEESRKARRCSWLAKGEADAEIERLQSIIDAFLRHRFGPRSEQLDPEQLQLGLERCRDRAWSGLGAEREKRRQGIGTRPSGLRKANRGSLSGSSRADRAGCRCRRQGLPLLRRRPA